MKQVYCSDDRLKVMNYKNLIENTGIEVTLNNEYSAGGSVPGDHLWLELWVNNSDYDKSIKLLDSLNTQLNKEEWVCKSCKEINDASFEICWKCQNVAP